MNAAGDRGGLTARPFTGTGSPMPRQDPAESGGPQPRSGSQRRPLKPRHPKGEAPGERAPPSGLCRGRAQLVGAGTCPAGPCPAGPCASPTPRGSVPPPGRPHTPAERRGRSPTPTRPRPGLDPAYLSLLRREPRPLRPSGKLRPAADGGEGGQGTSGGTEQAPGSGSVRCPPPPPRLSKMAARGRRSRARAGFPFREAGPSAPLAPSRGDRASPLPPPARLPLPVPSGLPLPLERRRSLRRGRVGRARLRGAGSPAWPVPPFPARPISSGLPPPHDTGICRGATFPVPSPSQARAAAV
nr:basic salivary proline-rich protein 1-like [Caretta caretta]